MIKKFSLNRLKSKQFHVVLKEITVVQLVELMCARMDSGSFIGQAAVLPSW